MNKIAKYIAIAFAVIIVVLLGILAFVNSPRKGSNVGKVVNAPIYAVSPDGHVKVFSPLPGQTIISPFTTQGNVTGGRWFFEGTFPVKVVDADGTVLSADQKAEQAEPGTWTSTGTVPFAGSISFSAPHSATGTIVFSRDNPSGLPQNDESFAIPVRFR